MEQIELIDIKKKLPLLKQPQQHKDTSKRGDYTELLVLTRLLKEGYTIALPYGNQPFWDILVEIDGHWQKWQIKTAYTRKARLSRNENNPYTSVSVDKRNRSKNRRYPPGSFDFLIAVHPTTNKMFKIPAEDALDKWQIMLTSNKYNW